MKRYCNNCKWFLTYIYSDMFDCRVVNKKIKTCTGGYQKEFRIAAQQNKGFDCKEYKRKWFIFWVKDK